MDFNIVPYGKMGFIYCPMLIFSTTYKVKKKKKGGGGGATTSYEKKKILNLIWTGETLFDQV